MHLSLKELNPHWRPRTATERTRRKLFQTERGAEKFADFLRNPPPPELDDWDRPNPSYEGIGELEEARVERRSIGEWGPS